MLKDKRSGKMPGKKAEAIHETDLYKPIHDYLEGLGYNVQSEVENCDIVAIKDDDILVVELKTAFNLKLLTQAVKRQRAADSVYVGIPKPKGGAWTSGWRDMCMLLRRLELGLITVDLSKGTEGVEVHFHPKTFDCLRSKRSGKKIRRSIIMESAGRSGQYNTGGCNRTKLITAYKEQAIHIACCLMKYGQLSPSQLKKLGTSAKTQNILSDNHYGWFSKVSRGVYKLNDCARDFMKEYPELVKHYMDAVDSTEKV